MLDFLAVGGVQRPVIDMKCSNNNISAEENKKQIYSITFFVNTSEINLKSNAYNPC